MSILCRADGGQNNLRTAAYEALMSLIKHSAKDCYSVICETTNIVMGRLQQAVQLDVSEVLYFLPVSVFVHHAESC